MVEIRPEESGDVAAVRDVNRRAFGQDLEGRIVDALRDNGGAVLSLVAIERGRVVGHVMYSQVRIGSVDGAALGPMAVDPDAQRRGIGTKLVQTGNVLMTRSGFPFIVVVGHPEFYPRFGFRPARALGITCEWDVPDDVFMALVLDDARMAGVTGPANFRSEFTAVQ